MITTVHLIVDQKHYPELIMKVENDIVNIALHILLKATSKNLLHGRFYDLYHLLRYQTLKYIQYYCGLVPYI